MTTPNHGGFCSRTIKTWCAMLNREQKVVTVIMELSKAFNTLNLKLLLKNYKFMNSIKKSLSSNRQQKTMKTDSFSKYHKIITLFQYFY